MRLSEEGIGLQYRAEAITEKLYNVDNAEIESKHKQRTYSISLARLATLHHSYGYQKRKDSIRDAVSDLRERCGE